MPRTDPMPAATCRRCSECEGADHHWLDNPDFGDEDFTPDPGDPGRENRHECHCKHCPAVGSECEACEGTGMLDPDSDDDDFFGHCEACGGSGVVLAAEPPNGDRRR